MAPLATGGHYANFMTAEELCPAAAGGSVHGTRAGQRLAAPKRRYDPDNVFRHSAVVRPAKICSGVS
jgi:hypothetical protein